MTNDRNWWYMEARNITKYLIGRYNALSFINYAEGKKNVAEIIYYQLAFKCSLMTLHYKFKSELFWEIEAIKHVGT